MPDHGLTNILPLFSKSEDEAPGSPSAIARLVEKCAAGDSEAFGELYSIFAPMVHAIVLARVRRDEVDDIVQQVFLDAFSGLAGLRNPAAFGGWLVIIARRRAARFYREERETEELAEGAVPDGEVRCEAREVLAKIRELPESYRETLIMRLVEEMTGPEIAGRTGMTADSVRVNLHRGMKMLREKLGLANDGKQR